ncbi:hypothetical protein C8R44DRAFT_890291 [Mycena epipterygia]|nr:hypothetical protein C8R44DRAFT_890291 [Mycena epipterygia]
MPASSSPPCPAPTPALGVRDPNADPDPAAAARMGGGGTGGVPSRPELARGWVRTCACAVPLGVRRRWAVLVRRRVVRRNLLELMTGALLVLLVRRCRALLHITSPLRRRQRRAQHRRGVHANIQQQAHAALPPPSSLPSPPSLPARSPPARARLCRYAWIPSPRAHHHTRQAHKHPQVHPHEHHDLHCPGCAPDAQTRAWGACAGRFFGAGRVCAPGAPTGVLATAVAVEASRRGESRVISPALRLSRAPTVNTGVEKTGTGVADPSEEVKEDADPPEETEDADPEVDREEKEDACVRAEPAPAPGAGAEEAEKAEKELEDAGTYALPEDEPELGGAEKYDVEPDPDPDTPDAAGNTPKPPPAPVGQWYDVEVGVKSGGEKLARRRVCCGCWCRCRRRWGLQREDLRGRAPWRLRGNARLVGGARARLRLRETCARARA